MPLSVGALLVVDERLGRQGRPVQRSVGQQDVVAERVDKRGQSFGAGFDDFARDHVAIDDDAAAFVRTRRTPSTYRRRCRRSDRCEASGQRRLGAAGELLPQRRQLGVAGQRPAGRLLFGSRRAVGETTAAAAASASAAANFSICAVCILCLRSASA